MANTVSGSVSLNCALGSSVSESLSGTISATMSGDDFIKTTQLIPTSITAIGLGNLASVGAYLIKNLDTTNYVDIFTSTAGVTILHLLPGSSAAGYFSNNITAPAAKSNTASVQIAYEFCEV